MDCMGWEEVGLWGEGEKIFGFRNKIKQRWDFLLVYRDILGKIKGG